MWTLKVIEKSLYMTLKRTVELVKYTSLATSTLVFFYKFGKVTTLHVTVGAQHN